MHLVLAFGVIYKCIQQDFHELFYAFLYFKLLLTHLPSLGQQSTVWHRRGDAVGNCNYANMYNILHYVCVIMCRDFTFFSIRSGFLVFKISIVQKMLWLKWVIQVSVAWCILMMVVFATIWPFWLLCLLNKQKWQNTSYPEMSGQLLYISGSKCFQHYLITVCCYQYG